MSVGNAVWGRRLLSKLSQLRTNKSPLLMTYLHKIDPANHPAANCPLCNDPNHDSLHLFNCPDIPTTLTVWDLWTDPVGVAALLDMWWGGAGRAPSGGLRSCACSRTGWGRHHHHQTIEHAMGECPRIHQPITQLLKPYLTM